MSGANELSWTTWELERHGGPRPAWMDVGSTSSLGCHRSTGSRSCLLHCGRARKVLVIWAAIREPMNQPQIAVEVAATGPQPRFEVHDRASQISISLSNGSPHLPMPSSVALPLLQTVNADCAATTARLVRNGQARRAMLVEFPARFFNRFARTTTGRHGSHDRFDAHFRRTPVLSRHAATHVALGGRRRRA